MSSTKWILSSIDWFSRNKQARGNRGTEDLKSQAYRDQTEKGIK